MKLRINTKLRAALIAAVTTVGFTITQAQAVTMYTQPTFGGPEYHWVDGAWQEGGNPARQGSKGPVLNFENVGTVNISGGIPDTSDYGGIRVTGDSTVTTSLGGWAGYIVVGKGSSLTASYNNDLKSHNLGENEASVYVEGQLKITGRANLWMTDGNSAQRWLIGEEGFVDLSAVSNVVKSASGWDIQLNVDAGEPMSLEGYTNRSLGGQLTKKFMSTGADLYGKVNNWAVFREGEELDSSKYTINHNASGMSVTYDAESAIKKMSLTWAGGEAAWEVKGTNWLDGEGTPTSFANGDDVTFTGSGDKANVGGAIEVDSLTVKEGGSTTLNVTEGSSLAANTTNVQGATLTLSGSGSVDLGATNFSNGNLVIDGREYSLGGQSHTMKTLTVRNGGVVTTTHDGSDGAVRGDIIIEAGSTFRVASGHDAFGWGDGYGNSTKSIIMGGTEGHVALLDIQGDNSSCTLGSAIQMNGYASITQKSSKAAFNANGCTITATGTHNNIDRLQIRKSMTITVNGTGSTLEVGQMTKHNEGDKVLTKSGDGTLIFTNGGAMSKLVQTAGTTRFDNGSTIDALEYTGGSLVFAGGTNTVTGNSNVLNTTISVTAGTLTLSGKYEIGGNTGSMTTTYEGGQSSADNGFAHASGSATVYTKAEGATVNVDNATFTVGGARVDVVNGVYTTAGSTNYGTFYVTTGTESLAHAIEYAGEHTVNTIAMSGTSTITMDQDGATIGLTLAAGATGTLDTTAAATLTSVSGAGTLVKAGEETLTITGANTAFTGDVTISEGTLKIGNQRALGEHNNGKSQTKTITIEEGGTLDLNGVTDANFKYTMAGGTLTNSDAALGAGSSQTTGLDLTADSTVHVDSGHDLRILARGFDATALNLNSKTLVKTGDGLFALKNTTVSAGTIEVQGGEVNFEVDPAKGGSTAANITLKGGNVSGTMNVSANITIDAQETTATGVGLNMNSHDLTLNVAKDKELSLTGNITNGASYTKNGAGTLNLGELGLTTGSFAVNAGTVNLESATKTGTGAYTLSGDGTVKLGLYGIDLQAGALNMSGKYDISDVYVDGEYSYEGGIYDGNGFAVMNGDALVVTIQEGATLATTGATFTWNGQEVDVNNTTGAATVSGTSYGSFYIFTESETVTTAKLQEYEHGTLSAIYVAEEGTLEVDQDINGSLIDGWSTGTVNIQESKTVTGTMEGVTLSGAGTYDLGSGVSTLGEGTSLGEDWRGTVKLSGITTKNLDLNNYGREGSVVEVDGWASHLNNTDESNIYTYNPTLRLTGDGMTVTDGYSGRTYIFAGGVEGEGDFTYGITTTASNQTYVFTGDVSNWYGVYESIKDGKTSTLKFYGDATDVGADIVQTAGTINLVVGNGTDEFSTVFNGEVTASSITVSELASATFENVNLLAAIVNHGEVSISYATLGDAFSQQGGDIAHFGLNGEITQDANYYIGSSEAYVQVVNGGTSTGSVTWNDDTYDLESNGRIIVEEEDVDYSTFYVNEGTVKVSDVTGVGQGTSFIEVTGGTLNVDQAGTGISIMVTDTGTLTGDELDVQEVGIAQYATASFAQGIHDDRGVEITSDEGTVDVTNIGSFTQAYTLEGEEMVVTAQSIVRTTDEEDITVSNWLIVEDITNVKSGKLTLEGQGEVMTVNNITVGLNSTVEILYQEGNKETTVTVTETLTAGNSTLLANLVMADDSALLVGGVEKALHVGSTLTMNTGIQMDEATLRELDGMAIGDTFWLIDAAEGRELVYMGESGDDAWYDGVFSRIAYGDDSDYVLQGDFNIAFSETDGFGLKKFSNTPEPTTGTLSLLALCALAARRRRKHN